MKILHLIDSAGFYGAERVLLELVEQQLAFGFDVTVGSIGDMNEGEKDLEIKLREKYFPCKTIRFPSGFNISAIKALSLVVDQSGCNIVHSHGFKPNVLLALWSNRPSCIKWVVTVHGWTIPRVFSKAWVYQCLDKFALFRADKVVAVSHHQIDIISPFLRKSVSVVNNGIDTFANHGKESSLAADILNRYPGKKIISFIGRLSYEKGLDVALEGFSEVLKYDGQVILLVAGNGPLLSEYKQLTRKLGIESQVDFLGYQADVKGLLGITSLLLMPSRTEGMPIILLEAMSCRVPILASSVGGMPTMLAHGDAGYLMEPDSSSELSSQVISFLNQSEDGINTIKQSAYERYHQCFTASVMSDAYSEIYKSL